MSEKEFVEVQQKPTLTQSTDNGMSAFLREVNDEFRQARQPETRTVPSDTQGVVKLNTGDKLMRMPGMEMVVTPDGSGVIVNTKDGESTLSVFGNAKVEHRDALDSPEYQRVKPGSMPSGFTQGSQYRITFPNGTVVHAEGNMDGRLTMVTNGRQSTRLPSR